MRTLSIAVVLGVLASAAPFAVAQTPIPAPSGWSSQSRAGGARTFSPPDLKTGEVYSITVYESASLGGKALEEWLRGFAGPVGKGVGQLASPLQIQSRDGRVVTGSGIYNGPNGTQLATIFVGVSLDGGANVHAARTLASGQPGLLARYQGANEKLMTSLVARAKAEAGTNIQSTPPEVSKRLRVGGKLVPGVYAGNQYKDQQLTFRFRLYIYPTGEYRLCDENDQDLKRRFFDEAVGQVNYNVNSGQLSISRSYDLGNSSADPDSDFCYFGRDVSNGKPAIYSEKDAGFSTYRTALTWVAPPSKRLSKSQAEERKAEIEAERNRYKWVVAPGKGVKTAQIAAVLLDAKFNNGSADETVYLLLRDGTVYADLPVPPDELDVIRSRQKEPDKWGKWRRVAGGYKVSWAGAPYQALPGKAASPAPAQQKLNGRWGTGRFSGIIGMSASSSQWGVTFSRNGRFRKDSRSLNTSSFGFGDQATHMASGHNDDESFAGGFGENFAVSSSQKKKNPNGNREGDYSLNGYVLTLRYDNGKVARLPFFFADKSQKTLWFEGATMSHDDDKK